MKRIHKVIQDILFHGAFILDDEINLQPIYPKSNPKTDMATMKNKYKTPNSFYD